MLTGESSLDAWMRGYENDDVLGRKSGTGRGSRDEADVPHHRYAMWTEDDKKDKAGPSDETHHTTGEAKIGGMVVRNTVTGELRTLSQVWEQAKDARYTLTEDNKVVAVESEPAPVAQQTPLQEAVGHITLAPQIAAPAAMVGEAFPIAKVA